jgi:hypothetical protein
MITKLRRYRSSIAAIPAACQQNLRYRIAALHEWKIANLADIWGYARHLRLSRGYMTGRLDAIGLDAIGGDENYSPSS